MLLYKSVWHLMPACLINPEHCLQRCPNSPHSSAELALFNDRATLGVIWHLEINAITSATPSPIGRGLFWLAPTLPGSRLKVPLISHILLIPDHLHSLFICLWPSIPSSSPPSSSLTPAPFLYLEILLKLMTNIPLVRPAQPNPSHPTLPQHPP